MKIGMFGLWGMNVPGIAFGGFETVYSEIGARLADLGYDVVIYCRRERYPKNLRVGHHRGVRLKYVSSIDTKNLSAISATWIAVVDSLIHENLDAHLFVNVGMGFHCCALKIFRKRVVLNVDGLDWQRGKWNWIAKSYFWLAAHVSVRSCDEIIADSQAMQKYYHDKFGRLPRYLSYGAHIIKSLGPEIIKEYGVEARRYFLIVSRFVPENNLHILIKAFENVTTDFKLVIVGGTNHPTDYEEELRSHRSNRIIFAGYISNRSLLDELFCNCYAYLHGHSVGGTNPALLDALGAGCCILAVDNHFNAEVLDSGRFGILFSPDINSAVIAMQEIIEKPEYAAKLREGARNRIRETYNWDRILNEYDYLLKTIKR